MFLNPDNVTHVNPVRGEKQLFQNVQFHGKNGNKRDARGVERMKGVYEFQRRHDCGNPGMLLDDVDDFISLDAAAGHAWYGENPGAGAQQQTGRGGKLGNHTEQSQIGYLLECDSGSRHFDMGRDMPVEIGFHGCAGSHGDESDNW